VTQILQGFASQIHVINELRNQASGAHPNKDVLAADEAMLVINGTATIFAYLNAKF
jgi:abortive infection Abi-like protein